MCFDTGTEALPPRGMLNSIPERPLPLIEVNNGDTVGAREDETGSDRMKRRRLDVRLRLSVGRLQTITCLHVNCSLWQHRYKVS